MGVTDSNLSGLALLPEGSEAGPERLTRNSVAISALHLHDLASDASIIRHGGKIKSVQDNALWFLRVAETYGSFGAMVGQWPVTDYFSLLAKMKKEGTRLGGTTGQYFLRFMGAPSFIASASVEAALRQNGVIEKALTTKAGQQAAQDACNRWMDESGRSLTTVSRVLAFSTDA